MQTDHKGLVRLLWYSVHRCMTVKATKLRIFCFTVKFNCKHIPETLAHELQ